MKTKVLIAGTLLMLFGNSYLVAQSPNFEVTVRAAYIEVTGSGNRFENIEQDFTAEFDTAAGYGLGLNYYFWDALSAEVTASVIEPDFAVTLFEEDGPGSAEALQMIPLTAGIQYHFRRQRRVDPYIGVGAAYILFDDLQGVEALAQRDVESIKLDDEVGFMANAGVSVGIFRRFALNLDAKYIEVKPEAVVTFDRGDFVAARQIEFSPVLISAGLAWRF